MLFPMVKGNRPLMGALGDQIGGFGRSDGTNLGLYAPYKTSTSEFPVHMNVIRVCTEIF